MKVPMIKLSDKMSVPCIGMGTFGSDKYGPEQVAKAVRGGIKAGYRLFDRAAVYGNEDHIGGALSDSMENGLVTREELVITSKVWNDMHKKGDVLLSCAKSLRDLRLDYIDIFFVHWPFRNTHAPGVDGDARNPDSKPFSPEEYIETWRQMERLYDMGLIKSIGMSNMTIPKMEAVLPHCRVKPVAAQMEIHPAFQQPELLGYCVKKGIWPIGYSPMGSPSRPERDKTPGDIAALEMPEILSIAKERGIHPAEVCLKWAVRRGQITIPFAVTESKYVSNLRCVTESLLTDEEMERIAKGDKNCRLVKGQVFLWEGEDDWRVLWDEDGTGRLFR